MSIIIGVIKESFDLMLEMAPWLLMGFFFSGLLYVFFPRERIVRHLGGTGILPVLKAALFGVPLPLCSCGVIPVVTAIRKQGASRGACLSFLVSTPTSGVDSVFATYSLLGPLFAVYRVVASFLMGIFSGLLANIFGGESSEEKEKPVENCTVCGVTGPHSHSPGEKLKRVFSYGFIELLEDVGRWILLGLLVGGTLTYFIPEGFIERYLGSGLLSMIVVLVVAVPVYVCATGSIPIAAALMLKGLSPGGGFVFLFAGPATNAVTITVIGKYLGKKSLAVYLFSIGVGSILLGLLLNVMWGDAEISKVVMRGEMLPLPIKLVCGWALLLLSLYSLRRYGKLRRKGSEIQITKCKCQHQAKSECQEPNVK
jgi:uncharacterized membrane protein YraQ (UPF0718 family)